MTRAGNNFADGREENRREIYEIRWQVITKDAKRKGFETGIRFNKFAFWSKLRVELRKTKNYGINHLYNYTIFRIVIFTFELSDQYLKKK